ncbi:MAG: Xaa-Pro peptidase family protein [Fimbriimonadaceae bacterium]
MIGRREKLSKLLLTQGVDAFFGWDPITLGYLHGFNEGAGERFSTFAVHVDGRSAMICPTLSVNQASRAGIKNIRSWKDGEDPMVLFSQLANEWNLKSSIIAVDAEMPARMLLAMQHALPGALFRQSDAILAALMRVKQSEEIDSLRRAASIADQAFPVAVAALKPGVTESEIDYILNTEMRRLGGTPMFSIVAAGPNGAEPHHLSNDTIIKEGDVVILDFGCHVDGYLSDITRTVCVGKPTEQAAAVYRHVYDAHMSARDRIEVGVACETIDQAARTVIDRAGYGEFFFHRTGHGIGMRGHEAPFIVTGNKETLAEGECFSIEPGIYLEGEFGVRIENIVTVTKSGHESLNDEPSSEILQV